MKCGLTECEREAGDKYVIVRVAVQGIPDQQVPLCDPCYEFVARGLTTGLSFSSNGEIADTL